MDSRQSLFFCFFFFLLLATSVPAELQDLAPTLAHWQTLLPQTPIPATIQKLLHPADQKKNYSLEIEKAPTVFISYKSAAIENQAQNDPNGHLFFLKDTITPGTKIVLDLTGITSAPPFPSPKEAAAAAPFSSDKLPQILALFSIERGSSEAAALRRALAECEEPPLIGESKRCVTSVESMVEFVEAELGRGDVRVVETAGAGGGVVAGRREYVVGLTGPRIVRAEAVVSCHPEPYPTALYYCHATEKVEIYKVHLLASEEAIAVDAAMTCHTDTSSWNPHYIGFKLLKVKPGAQPICHFMPHRNLIFALLSNNPNPIN